jgi:magnesium-transporting ATPase (P-type)
VQVFSILANALVMVASTLYIYNEELSHDDPGDRSKRANTMAFTTFVLCQMWNALNCRSDMKARRALSLSLSSPLLTTPYFFHFLFTHARLLALTDDRARSR